MPLLVTIELIPYGIKANKKTIGELYIVNTGTGTVEIGNYDFYIKETEEDVVDSAVVKGNIKNFTRDKGCWSLVKQILNDIEGTE